MAKWTIYIIPIGIGVNNAFRTCVRSAEDGHLLVLVVLNLNSVNRLIFVMVKCGVLFEVRNEFLNNI
jgi:hypothetical protein